MKTVEQKNENNKENPVKPGKFTYGPESRKSILKKKKPVKLGNYVDRPKSTDETNGNCFQTKPKEKPSTTR